jgi:hypothetical protein
VSSKLREDPAVLGWRVALTNSWPSAPAGGHWWRDTVTDAFRCATAAWELAAEAASNGWATELADFTAAHPRPQLRDFMVHLSAGRMP